MLNQRTDVKARWTDEELVMLARREAELLEDPSVRFMNQELMKYVSNRTLESVKGVRWKQAYKDLVERFREGLVLAGSLISHL